MRQKFATVEKVQLTQDVLYENEQPSQVNGPTGRGTHVIRIYLRGPSGGEWVEHLPNGGFDMGNPTLQFLAYVGAKLSDFDGHTLEVNRQVPVLRTGEDEYAMSNDVLEVGAEMLEEVSWSPIVDHESDDPGSNAAPNGSDDDNDDDNIRVINDDDSDGVTVHVE